jgi:hypothetical protein
MFISGLGALFFGIVIGWISYRTLRLTAGTAVLSDIATIIGAVGGAAVTALFRSDVLFGLYCVGLALGFFGYLGYGVYVYGKQEVQPWHVISAPVAPAAIGQAPAAPASIAQAPATPVPVDQPPAAPAENDKM